MSIAAPEETTQIDRRGSKGAKHVKEESKLSWELCRSVALTLTMNVLTETNGHANGIVDYDMEPAVATARFASGLILPPPEIKCPSCSVHVIHSINFSQPSLTELLSLSPALLIHLNSRTKFAKASAPTPNSLFSIPRIRTMPIIATKWTRSCKGT